MQKVLRDKTRRIMAAALKPPAAVVKEEGTPPELSIVFVTQNGQERKHKCTSEAFTRVAGRRQKAREHTGLDMQTGRSYILHVDAGTNLVTHVDDYPVSGSLHRMKPSDADTNTELIVSILGDGTLTVKARPYGISDQSLHSLLEALDKREAVEAGDTWHGFRVSNIVGTFVHFTIDDEGLVSMQTGVNVD